MTPKKKTEGLSSIIPLRYDTQIRSYSTTLQRVTNPLELRNHRQTHVRPFIISPVQCPVVQNRSYSLHNQIYSCTPHSRGQTRTYCTPHRIPTPLEWSYLAVGGEKALLGQTVGQVLEQAAEQYGDREAVVSVHQGVRSTFTTLLQDSSNLAAGLVAMGLEPGDRLGIWSPNCYEWVVTQYAAAIAGVVLVNINPSYLSSELQYCLNKVEVKVLVCAPSFKETQYYSLLTEVLPTLPAASPVNSLSSDQLPALKTVVMMGEHQWPGTIRYQDVPSLATSEHYTRLETLKRLVQFDDACNIQFTSGTTGLPKGAVLSHHNLVNNAYFIGYRSDYMKQAHRICVSVPLYHCFGCVAGSLAGGLFGATCVLPSESFSGRASIEALYSESVTSLYGTPTMFVDMLAAARKRAGTSAPRLPPHLFTGIMAGAPCPPHLVNDVITLLNMKDFLVMYGMTETSPVTFQCYPNDPPSVRANTIGFASDHTEVKIVDNDGRIVPVGVEGELCVRGYCVFQGYWADPVKTREVLGDDRWFKTGDLATLDRHGYGNISGRAKDLIIRGGENVYPAELENAFRACPGVMEAQVFGVPDPRLGEEVAVWLRLDEGAVLTGDEFKDWCRGRMARYKVPRYVQVKDTFPVTVTGKIQKFIMKKQTMQELGIKE